MIAEQRSLSFSISRRAHAAWQEVVASAVGRLLMHWRLEHVTLKSEDDDLAPVTL